MRTPLAVVAAAMLVTSTAGQAQTVCANCQTVAVMDIQSEENCQVYEGYWGTFVVLQCQRKFREIRDMVETALKGTNKFRLFERDRADLVLDERRLAATGQTRGASFRTRLTGVDFIVFGKVTEFSRGSSSTSNRNYASNSDDAAMAIDLKLVNVRTGQIVRADTIRETLETAASYESDRVSGETSMDAARVAGLLQRAVAVQIARLVAFQGNPLTVISPPGPVATLNYGRPFLQKGMLLQGFSLGPPLVDPTTGSVLERQRIEVGRYEVRSVTPFTANAQYVPGSGPMLKAGDQMDIVEADEGGGSIPNL